MVSIVALVGIVGSVAYCRDINRINTASEELVKIQHAKSIVSRSADERGGGFLESSVIVRGDNPGDFEEFNLTKEKTSDLLNFMETYQTKELDEAIK